MLDIFAGYAVGTLIVAAFAYATSPAADRLRRRARGVSARFAYRHTVR